MAVLGVGVGLVMQNLVLAAQNDVPARELGAATSVVTFFRSMGGTIGVVRIAVQEAYGNATADLFMISVPIAVLFIKEKPLLTTSASERVATEDAEAAGKLGA